MMYSVCGEITDIYEHWVSEHSFPPKPQPFRFEVLTLLSCYYCDHIVPYHRMVEHHQASHYNESFIAITASQPNKCAMCQSTNLVGHFELNHEIFLRTKNANPVFMKDELVMKLNKIDIYKKPQCGYCEAIFESEHELNAHHSVAHPSRDILIKHLCDNRVSHVICGFCSDSVAPKVLLEHFKSHSYGFRCSLCDFQSNDLVVVTMHERTRHQITSFEFRCLEFSDLLQKSYFDTKVVFGNGLVLTKYNLLKTHRDDSAQFEPFILTLVQAQKERFVRMKGNDGTEGSEVNLKIKRTLLNKAMTKLDKIGSKTTLKKTSSSLVQIHKINDIIVKGIPRIDNEDLTRIFLKLCKTIKANISSKDIFKIHRVSKINPTVSVRFKDSAAKLRMLKKSNEKIIRTKEFMDLPNGVCSTFIRIQSQT